MKRQWKEMKGKWNGRERKMEWKCKKKWKEMK